MIPKRLSCCLSSCTREEDRGRKRTSQAEQFFSELLFSWTELTPDPLPQLVAGAAFFRLSAPIEKPVLSGSLPFEREIVRKRAASGAGGGGEDFERSSERSKQRATSTAKGKKTNFFSFSTTLSTPASTASSLQHTNFSDESPAHRNQRIDHALAPPKKMIRGRSSTSLAAAALAVALAAVASFSSLALAGSDFNAEAADPVARPITLAEKYALLVEQRIPVRLFL